MASYCEVCLLGLSTTPHPHGMQPVLASRGPSPRRHLDGARDGVVAPLPSPPRPPRHTSPYRSTSSRLPPRGASSRGTSPLSARADMSGMRGYARGTYSSERRRSSTSSPLRGGDGGDGEGSFLACTTRQTTTSNAPPSRSTEAALAKVLTQMREAATHQGPSLSGQSLRRHAAGDDKDAQDRADRYRYTHAHLPPRQPLHTQGHPYDAMNDTAPSPSWEPSSEAASDPHRAYAFDAAYTPPARAPAAMPFSADSTPLTTDKDHRTPTTTTDKRRRRDEDDRDARVDERCEAADRLGDRQARLKQTAWQQAITARVEELRAGFVDLCAAVRQDMHALEARCGAGLANSGAVLSTAALVPPLRPSAASSAALAAARAKSAGRSASSFGDHSPGSCDRPTRESSPFTTGTDEDDARGVPASRPQALPSLPALIELVRRASASDRRHLAKALWEDMRPLMQKELQRTREVDQHRLETHVKTRCDDLLAELEQTHARSLAAAVSPPIPPPTPPAPPMATEAFVRALLPMDFSSPDALEAHLRAVARRVLAEEDAHRMGMASYNEQRHTEAWQAQQQSWQTELKRAEREWRRECAETMATARHTWAHEDRHEVHRELNRMQQLVEAVVGDVAALTHQVTDSQDRQAAWMEDECRRRRHDEAQSASALKAELTTMITSLHAQHAQQALSRSASHAAPVRLVSGPLTGATPEAVREEVVQPALEHMKRLLAAHQKVVDATVDRRCALAEQSVADRQHMWDQHVTELRAKVTSLRTDVRSAFSELCQGLNVAAPGL